MELYILVWNIIMFKSL